MHERFGFIACQGNGSASAFWKELYLAWRGFDPFPFDGHVEKMGQGGKFTVDCAGTGPGILAALFVSIDSKC